MNIGKLAILFSDMPDKVTEAELKGKGYQVFHIIDKKQLQAYNLNNNLDKIPKEKLLSDIKKITN